MKMLFGLLLLACAGFLVFMRWGDALMGDGAHLRPRLPLNEEKIKLLKAPQAYIALAPASSLAAVPAAAASPCLEWGEFSGGDLARAAAALDGLNLGTMVTQRQVERNSSYWVYIPPRQSRAETDKKVAQLKSLGIEEYFIVQDAGKWQHAISLGVFKTEDAAQKFLEKIRDKGVKSATVGERAGKLTLALFTLSNPEAEISAKMVELQSEFPGSELKAVACE
ncbi:MAG: sporulation domain protein [Gallionellaceae bacterium]|nr:MAG: sporulation domain protein [Gallionellaceae bacterium]